MNSFFIGCAGLNNKLKCQHNNRNIGSGCENGKLTSASPVYSLDSAENLSAAPLLNLLAGSD